MKKHLGCIELRLLALWSSNNSFVFRFRFQQFSNERGNEKMKYGKKKSRWKSRKIYAWIYLLVDCFFCFFFLFMDFSKVGIVDRSKFSSAKFWNIWETKLFSIIQENIVNVQSNNVLLVATNGNYGYRFHEKLRINEFLERSRQWRGYEFHGNRFSNSSIEFRGGTIGGDASKSFFKIRRERFSWPGAEKLEFQGEIL